MTKNRKALLQILKDENLPLNASQIHSRAGGIPDLATVYRGLTFLEENNYIFSFVFDCKNRGVERYYAAKKDEHEHFMHCEKCHKFTAIPVCPLKDSFAQIKQNFGFTVDEHFLTLKGVCRNCTKDKTDIGDHR